MCVCCVFALSAAADSNAAPKSCFFRFCWWNYRLKVVLLPECSGRRNYLWEVKAPLLRLTETEAFLLNESPRPAWSIHGLLRVVLSVSSFWPLEIIRTLTGADCFPWLQPCGQTQNIYMDRDSRHILGAFGNWAVKTWIHEFLITQSVGWSIIQFYLWGSMSGSILTCTYSGLLLTRWVLSPWALMPLWVFLSLCAS